MKPHMIFPPRLIQRLLLVASTLSLVSCLHLQLGGPVSDAEITIAPLREPSNILQRLSTPSVDEARSLYGAENWDSADELLQLITRSSISIDADLYDEDALYLVTAIGGVDHDADSDLQIDATPAAVGGRWHAIMTGKQLQSGMVSPLTEIAYRLLDAEIGQLSDEEIFQRLDQVARQLVSELNQSGVVDYDDLLVWNRYTNQDGYLHDLGLVDALAAAVRANASAADLRELSQEASGQSSPFGGGPFEVSGTIRVTSLTRVDGDVNDPAASYLDNDSIANAQDLVNPVVLGGYVNLPGEGPPGRSQVTGDIDDYYRVDLLAGQLITLTMAGAIAANDVDLYLYREDGTLVDASLSVLELDQLTVPADGRYLVAVTAYAGGSNYRLTVGIGSQQMQVEQLRLSDDFVPGEIIARFREQHPGVNTLGKRARLTGMGVRGGLRRANLLRLPEQALQASSIQKRKLNTMLAMKRLRRAEEVSSADLNYTVRAAGIPSDPLYEQQSWHYEQIALPSAWERSLGDDVIVAVVDTGVFLDHPDLAGQLVAGYDFISSTGLSLDGDGIDSNPDDPGDSTGAAPSSFHGTHVSGTVAAASDNNQGVAGAAWNARVMPLRALGKGGSGSIYDVMQAVRYAAGLSNDSGRVPERRADVINLSLSGGGFTNTGQRLYSDVADLGIITVAAAGNDDTDTPAYPASFDGVISVAATGGTRVKSSYSNYGPTITVAAPGGDVFDLVLSTAANDRGFADAAPDYGLKQGTSMASPHVAGVVALMKSVYPELTVSQFESLLQQGGITEDLGLPGRDDFYGYGLINAYKAVLAAENLASGGMNEGLPLLSVSPRFLNFGQTEVSLPLNISNAGTGELTVSSVQAADSWVTVSAGDIDANGLGSYDVQVDRDALELGIHSSRITVDSSNGQREVALILQESDSDLTTDGDAGLHYVLLVDAENGELEQEVIVAASEGSYAYQFSNVPAGNYQIIASSDADADLGICDAGEACGAYRILDPVPNTFPVGEDLTGLDFYTSFNTGILSSQSGRSAFAVTRRSQYRASTHSRYRAVPHGQQDREP
jgi:serine protease